VRATPVQDDEHVCTIPELRLVTALQLRGCYGLGERGCLRVPRRRSTLPTRRLPGTLIGRLAATTLRLPDLSPAYRLRIPATLRSLGRLRGRADTSIWLAPLAIQPRLHAATWLCFTPLALPFHFITFSFHSVLHSFLCCNGTPGRQNTASRTTLRATPRPRRIAVCLTLLRAYCRLPYAYISDYGLPCFAQLHLNCGCGQALQPLLFFRFAPPAFLPALSSCVLCARGGLPLPSVTAHHTAAGFCACTYVPVTPLNATTSSLTPIPSFCITYGIRCQQLYLRRQDGSSAYRCTFLPITFDANTRTYYASWHHYRTTHFQYNAGPHWLDLLRYCAYCVDIAGDAYPRTLSRRTFAAPLWLPT